MHKDIPNKPYVGRKVKARSDYLWEFIMGGALLSIVLLMALVASPALT